MSNLRNWSIVGLLAAGFIGLGIWLISVKQKQDRIKNTLTAEQAEQAEADKYDAKVVRIYFTHNQLIPAAEEPTQEDFYGQWRCKSGQGELILEFSKRSDAFEDSGGADFNSSFKYVGSNTDTYQPFHHSQPDPKRMRLAFTEQRSGRRTFITGECTLINKQRLYVKAEFEFYSRIMVDAVFVKGETP
ncbi:MAG: hypothetical protein NTV29_03620 [Planctomycetota bacterium]|nr:hypothetical protein [Planctomycetota bacterium]